MSLLRAAIGGDDRGGIQKEEQKAPWSDAMA